MGRLLLSQSQVSVVLTCVVAFFFTLALFLSGYTLQQRTLAQLQTSLRPRQPQTPSSHKPPPSLLTPSRIHLKSEDAYTHPPSEDVLVDWTRLAHVQLVTTHHNVCNALMLFGDLDRLRSPARRILLFPRDWAQEHRGGDPDLEISRRLMRRAARRYKVELRPIRAEGEADGWVKGMTDLDRVLKVRTPGLVFESGALDAVLAFAEQGSSASLVADVGVESDDILLLSPSSHPPSTNITTLSPSLLHSIDALHTVVAPFDSAAWLENTSYILFSDSKLPGPEYDVPWSMKIAARPKDKDADWTWTKLYGEFALRRLEVCGLELEEWRE